MKRDLRNYARQTNLRLIAGALLILLIVGEGLIFIIYGPGAAVTGLLCIGAGLFPVILIVLIFFGIDWIIKRANRE
jgi:membrane protein implicated in regulation of membrane protease activity